MAGVSLGPILNAVTNATSLVSKPKSLRSFLDTINDYGVQVANNFEVNFSGLEFVTFFVSSINLPEMKENFIDIYYDGRAVKVPVNYDNGKQFDMTVLNDAQGYLYPAIVNLLMTSNSNRILNSGLTMIVKGLTGDDKHYNGFQMTIRGIRIESVSKLSFSSSNNNVQTFDISFNCVDYEITSGGLASTVSNVVGLANSILG